MNLPLIGVTKSWRGVVPFWRGGRPPRSIDGLSLGPRGWESQLCLPLGDRHGEPAWGGSFLVRRTVYKPVPAGKRKLESGHFSRLQIHFAREPRTPVDRGNRNLPERGYSGSEPWPSRALPNLSPYAQPEALFPPVWGPISGFSLYSWRAPIPDPSL
jgi:hypothetical protein